MRNAQTVLEYVLIFVAVSAAVAGVSAYVQRSMNARMYEVVEEYVPPSIDMRY